jgi:PPOX class F420-dependent enzyme/OxyR family protein/uncharacterized protein (TIGR02246 family)
VTTQLLDAAHARYLGERQRGVLTTIAANGWPQAKPVGFRYDPQQGTIDVSGYDMERSAKFGNVAANPRVVFSVNDVIDPDAGAEGVRFLEIRGVAEQVRLNEPVMPGISRWILRIHPRRLVSYNVAGPGMHTADLTGAEATTGDTRPVIGIGGSVAERARRAVQRQVAELQAGLDAGDADTYNRHFAEDVIWGSPYGATVEGYDTLHVIHARLQAAGEHRRSRYQVVRVRAATPDVALAQVRRDALDEAGEPIPSRDGEARFSEMALYVLVRRDGAWWLAAGQNTVINVDRGAV